MYFLFHGELKMTASDISYTRDGKNVFLHRVNNLDSSRFPNEPLRRSDLFDAVSTPNRCCIYADAKPTLVLYVPLCADPSQATSGKVLARSAVGGREIYWEANSVYNDGTINVLQHNGDRFSSVSELVQAASEEQEAERRFGQQIADTLHKIKYVHTRGPLFFSDLGFPHYPTFTVSVRQYVPTKEGGDEADSYNFAIQIEFVNDRTSQHGHLNVNVFDHNSNQFVRGYAINYVEPNINNPNNLKEILTTTVINRVPEMLRAGEKQSLQHITDLITWRNSRSD